MNTAKQPFRASDLRRRKFFIDVSRQQPYVVQSNHGKEFPLPSLTAAELATLRQLAANQLRQGIFEDHDTVAEYRATLYFLNAWSDRAALRHGDHGDRSARTRLHGAKPSSSTGQAA